MTDVDMSDTASHTAAPPASEVDLSSNAHSLPEPTPAAHEGTKGGAAGEEEAHAEREGEAAASTGTEAPAEASPESRKRHGSPGVDTDGRDKRPRNEEAPAPGPEAPSSSASAAGEKPTASQLKDTIAHNVNAGNLDVYVWEYLKRRNLTKTAASLVEETGLPSEPDVPIRLPRGLLFEYWTLFWDLFRSRVGLGTREAALFGDYLENRRRQAIQEAKTKTFTAPLFPDAATGLSSTAGESPAAGLSLGLAAASAAPLATDATQSLMLSQDPTGVPALGPAAPIVGAQGPGAGTSPNGKMQRSSSSPSSPAAQAGMPSTPASSAQNGAASAPAQAASLTQPMVQGRAPAAQTPAGPAPPNQPQQTPQMRGQNTMSTAPPGGAMAQAAPLSMKPAAPNGMPVSTAPAAPSSAPATPSLQQQQQMQMQMQLQMQMQQALARGQMGQGVNPAMLTPQQQQQLLVTAAMRQGIPLDDLKNMAPAARMALLNTVLPNAAQTAAMAAMQAQGPRANDPQMQARLLLQQQQLMQVQQMQGHAAGQSKTAPSSPATFQALFNRSGQRMGTPSQLGASKPGNGAEPAATNQNDAPQAQHGLGQRPMGMPMPMQLTPQQRQMLMMQYQTLQTAMKNEWMKAQSAPVPAMAQQCMATVQQLQAKLQSMAALLQSEPAQQGGAAAFTGDGQSQAMLQHLQQQAQVSNGANAALLGQAHLGPMMNAAQGQAPRPNGFGEVDVSGNGAMASYFGMGGNAASLAMQQQRRAPGPTPAQPPGLGVRPPMMSTDGHQGMVGGMMPQAARSSVTAPATPQAAHAAVPGANGAGASVPKGARGHVRPPASTPGRPDMPMSPWQPPAAQDSPSSASGKKERPRKPGRPASNKTPVLPTRTPWNEGEEAVPKEEPSEWDAGSKGESDASQTRSMGGDNSTQSILDSMPSMMDDVTSGLAMSSSAGLSSGAPAGGANDDFSAMFGVSDIFDFDFDGGDGTGSQAGGLFAGGAPTASEPSEGAANRDASGA